MLGSTPHKSISPQSIRAPSLPSLTSRQCQPEGMAAPCRARKHSQSAMPCRLSMKYYAHTQRKEAGRTHAPPTIKTHWSCSALHATMRLRRHCRLHPLADFLTRWARAQHRCPQSPDARRACSNCCEGQEHQREVSAVLLRVLRLPRGHVAECRRRDRTRTSAWQGVCRCSCRTYGHQSRQDHRQTPSQSHQAPCDRAPHTPCHDAPLQDSSSSSSGATPPSRARQAGAGDPLRSSLAALPSFASTGGGLCFPASFFVFFCFL